MFGAIIFFLILISICKCVLVAGEFWIGVASMVLTKVPGTKYEIIDVYFRA